MRVPINWLTLFSTSTSVVFIPATFWRKTEGIKKLRPFLETRQQQSGIEVGIAYQTADVENNPDSATLMGSLRTADGVYYPSAAIDVESTFAGKQLVRFGFLVKNTSGTSLYLAMASAILDIIG